MADNFVIQKFRYWKFDGENIPDGLGDHCDKCTINSVFLEIKHKEKFYHAGINQFILKSKDTFFILDEFDFKYSFTPLPESTEPDQTTEQLHTMFLQLDGKFNDILSKIESMPSLASQINITGDKQLIEALFKRC